MGALTTFMEEICPKKLLIPYYAQQNDPLKTFYHLYPLEIFQHLKPYFEQINTFITMRAKEISPFYRTYINI